MCKFAGDGEDVLLGKDCTIGNLSSARTIRASVDKVPIA